MPEQQPYAVSCLITGSTDNLSLHSMRNKEGKVIGWVFLSSELISESTDLSINWDFVYRTDGNKPVEIEGFIKVHPNVKT